MERGAISRDDILKTLEEYDDLGAQAFFDFKEARKYLLLHDGREYDSKAVAGVAHKHQHGRALTWKELSGGVGHAVDWLRREGFQSGHRAAPNGRRSPLPQPGHTPAGARQG